MFQPPFAPATSGTPHASGPSAQAGEPTDPQAAELLRQFVRFADQRRPIAALALLLVGVAFEGIGILLLVQVVQWLVGGGADLSDLPPGATGFVSALGRPTQLALVLSLIAAAIVRGLMITR